MCGAERFASFNTLKRLDGTRSHNRFPENDDIAGTFTSSALPDALAISREGAVPGTLMVLRLAIQPVAGGS